MTNRPVIYIAGPFRHASATQMAANVMTAAAAAADLTTELQSGLATAAALQTVDDEIAVIDGNVDTLLTRITSSLFTGITSLAEWLGLIAGKQTGNTTARTELRATGAGSGTFDETTDSQEALRDRGDAAWTTATGFSTHSAADVWAAGTRTLTANTNLNDPTAAAIADAVWEEAIADHSGTAGSTAEALNAAGSAGDPWTTTLPGSYTGSQAGKMLSDILVDTGTTLQAELDGIQADTEDIQTRLPAALVGGRIDATVDATGMEAGAVAAISDGVWDELQSGHVGVGTFGEVATEVASILVDTAEIGAAGAGLTEAGGTGDHLTAINLPDQTMNITGDITGNLSGSVGSVTGNVGGNVTGSVGSLATQAKADVNTEVDTAISDAALATAANLATAKTAIDAIKVITDALTAAAAAKLAASSLGIITGTVDTTVAPSTTEFECDDITEATADHYIGRIVTFTSGALAGQSTDITDYSLASGKGHFVVTALTEAPGNNDSLVIT